MFWRSFFMLLIATSIAFAGEPTPIGKKVTVFHLGNSLTRGLTVNTGGGRDVDRMGPLFESAGGQYKYNGQLAAGAQLDQHVAWGIVETPSRKINQIKSPGGQDVGLWSAAWQKNKYDAIILQPHRTHLDKEMPAEIKEDAGVDFGDRQSIKKLITYAMGDNPAKHIASNRFYLYQTWPYLKDIDRRTDGGTFEAFWTAPYDPAEKQVGQTVPSRDYLEKLIKVVRQDNPDATIGVIPAGEVLCALDVKIRKGDLPGLADYLKRQGKEFDAAMGVTQFYSDGIHMNPLPHNDAKCGTIGAYTAAITIYATLSGESPVGLSVKMYEQLDEKTDAELIKAIQQTVWDIVSSHPHTGVKKAQ